MNSKVIWLLGIAGLFLATPPVFAEVLNCTNVVEHTVVPSFVSGKEIRALPANESERTAYEGFLRDRYGFKSRDIVWGKKYPMVVHGGDEASFRATADIANAKIDPGQYDAVIIGGGPAGLTAGIYLTDAGKRVLILEKDEVLGGLAAGGQSGGVNFGRGAAYFTATEGDTYNVYKHLGFGQYKKNYTIHGAIDSYYWNGKFYEGLWESPEALAELPASFALFKYYLHHADHMKMIPTQPFDEFPNLFLDTLSMRDWVKTYPEEMRKLAATDPEAKKVYDRFLADPKVDKKDPMSGPIGLLDLYGRSALGDHTDKVSAASFANFYISELDVRYTGNLGTGSTMSSVVRKLRNRDNLVTVKTNAPLAKIRTTSEGVEFYYVEKGVTYFGKAKDAVYAAQLSSSLRTIEDFEKIAPKQFEVAKSIKYRDYLVVNVHVEGHPWKKTYDTWVRNDATYSKDDPTDIIDGRWQDFRGETLPRNDNRGILTVYHPLPEGEVGKGFDKLHATELAERAIEKMKLTIDPLSREAGEGKPVNVLAAEVNRWPYSIHLTEPGHFRNKAKILKEPIGNIYFVNNNVGTPAIEEGIFNAHKAAQTILKKQGIDPAPTRLPMRKPKPKKSASAELFEWPAAA